MSNLSAEELEHILWTFGHYGNVPVSSQEVFLRDYFDVMVLAPGPGNLKTTLVDFSVPKDRVLDLSVIRFRVALRAPTSLLLSAADDLESIIWLRWLIEVYGKNPMDQGSTIGAANQPKPPAGFIVLNRNVLGSGDDVPAHLIVREGQRIKVSYSAAPSAPFTDFPPYVGVELKGRWLTQKRYNDLLKRRLR